MNKKILLVSLLSAGVLAGCGSSDNSDSVATNTSTGTAEDTTTSASDYVPDLSQKVDLTIALNYDGTNNRITYQKGGEYTTPDGKTTIKVGDYKPVWSTLQSELNFTATEVEKAVAKKAVDYFKENWATDQYADLAAANVSDVNTASVAGSSETIIDISEYLDYLPNFSKFLADNPSVRQSITSTKHSNNAKGAMYYFPYFDGFDDLEKMTLVRADYVEKLLDGNTADLDTDATLLTNSQYTATEVDGSGKAVAYSVTVPTSLTSNTTKVIAKASVDNIITQQNTLIASGQATSKALVEQYKKYMDDRYGAGKFAKYSDLFLGVDSCYDADEMVALMRIVKASPKALTGNADKKMVAFVPREYNNQRIADLYRWAGQLWGVRGVESRSGYLFIDSEGNVKDARGTQEAADMLENLNKLYKEGLIVENFEEKNAAGTSNGKFAENLIVGTGTGDYAGFMEYDYSQTQGVWNDKDASKAITGYNFRPILGGVANWDDGDSSTSYYHFTESWRSVKTQGLVLNASLKNDNAKLMRALALCDYFFSAEGQQLNSYGPESMGYTSGTISYQGRTVAKFTEAALAQLNDSAIGAGSYTGYLRTYVGATLPVGYVKEQGMEYQCTSAKAIAGLDVINKAIEVGTYKHVMTGAVDNSFFKIVPSSFLLSQGQASQVSAIETSTTLGSIHSKSGTGSGYSYWDQFVMYGFGDTTHETESKAEYLNKVNNTWQCATLVGVYQTAYDNMNS